MEPSAEPDRICQRCRRTLPQEQFAFRHKREGRRQSYCRECKAVYQRSWYERNQERHRRNVADIRRQRVSMGRDIMRKAKDVPCADCGQRYPPWVMDFDHVRGHKTGNVSQMLDVSLDALRREIAKCQVVCANCHRQRTHDRQKRRPSDVASETRVRYRTGASVGPDLEVLTA